MPGTPEMVLVVPAPQESAGMASVVRAHLATVEAPLVVLAALEMAGTKPAVTGSLEKAAMAMALVVWAPPETMGAMLVALG